MNPFALTLLLAAAGPSSQIDRSPGSVLTFSRSYDITNPAVGFVPGQIRVLVGAGSDGADRIVAREGQATRTFAFAGQAIVAQLVREEVWEGGRLVERSRTYLAQADNGIVYTFGEIDDFDAIDDEDDQDDDTKGWVVGGVLPSDPEGVASVESPVVRMPAQQHVGTAWRSEVPPEGERLSVVTATGLTVDTPAGRFTDCFEVLEQDAGGGDVARAWYAPGHGCVASSEEVTPAYAEHFELEVLALSLGRVDLRVEQVGRLGATRSSIELDAPFSFEGLQVIGPSGRVIVSTQTVVAPRGLRLDSSEVALEFGRYRFRAQNPAGALLYEELALEPRPVAPPTLLAPRPGQSLSRSSGIVRWSPLPAGQLGRIVVHEWESDRVLVADLAAGATAFDLTAWLSPAAHYTLELSARMEGGHARTARLEFSTGP